MKTPIIKSKTAQSSCLSSHRAYFLPERQQFKYLSPGESWLCKNYRNGSKPPRGKIYKKGKKRFESRSWLETENNVFEYLPTKEYKKFVDEFIDNVYRKMGVPYGLIKHY